MAFPSPSRADSAEPAYLLRVERLLPGEGDCVLVRADGQYHVERIFEDKSDIFEGHLSAAARQNLVTALSNDALAQISQAQIPDPREIAQRDGLNVAILRSRDWQTLRFSSAESRKPYQQSLNPIMTWFDDLRMQKHVALSEDAARNNCLPPAEIKLKVRDPKSVTRRDAELNTDNFFLRLVLDSLTEQRSENMCVIVYPAGRYRMERKTAYAGGAARVTEAFEDTLTAAELMELQAILDDPKLVQRRFHEPPTEAPVGNAELARLAIPRAGQVQNLNFWKYFGAVRPGSGGLPSSIDNGMKLLKPLKRWLQTNIEERAEAPLQNAHTTSCLPTPQQQSAQVTP